jgi:hypothetical protein
MRTMIARQRWVIALLLFFWAASYVEANIVIRGVIINPNEANKRKVPFKSYLPKEVKPENVVDMGDLELAFDPTEGAYYVHKIFELEPKETVNIEVEMEDVWRIAQTEIDDLRNQAQNVVRVLSNTDYFERASYLKNSIESKLGQIEQTQRVSNPSPSGYISDFRENIKLLESVKADLAAAKALMAEAKSVSPMLTWKIIIAVIGFLALLGLIFFFIWQRQIKSLAEFSSDYAGAQDATRGTPSPEREERRQAPEEKKAGLSDIEERLRQRNE